MVENSIVKHCAYNTRDYCSIYILVKWHLFLNFHRNITRCITKYFLRVMMVMHSRAQGHSTYYGVESLSRLSYVMMHKVQTEQCLLSSTTKLKHAWKMIEFILHWHISQNEIRTQGCTRKENYRCMYREKKKRNHYWKKYIPASSNKFCKPNWDLHCTYFVG